MLKLRRRNSDDDAVQHARPILDVNGECMHRHANLLAFSVRAGFDDRVRPANHRVQVGAGGHHRVDRVLLLDPEIDHHRPGVSARVVDRRQHLAALA